MDAYAEDMLSLLSGLGLGLSLIIAIGAQNVFVLRQGLRREHVLPVVVICALSDAILIAAGVAGLGYLVENAPWLVPVARLLGGGFLIVYGFLAARRAWNPSGGSLLVDDSTPIARDTADAGSPADHGEAPGATRTRVRSGRTAVLLTALALTWLNPNVYLDTVLLLGSIASTHGDARWMFAVGAMTASVLWFFALGFGAHYLGRWLRTPRAWRVLDAGIAALMILLGVNLMLPVFFG
ncbi:putative transporter [Microbacterium keratanolyticum]|uniref:Transporter n=2 Tax=Microbacterium keratanolyticum TaxID=67574 RepID=A0A9W6HUG5_9MICO|nr:putative transporter [Microbacterium keratanolyticum]